MILRIKHNLTFYHYRSNRKSPHVLGVCSCGKRFGIFRQMHRKTMIRSLIFCSWRKHKWDEPYPIEIGPAGAPDEEFEIVGYDRQCERCYKVQIDK